MNGGNSGNMDVITRTIYTYQWDITLKYPQVRLKIKQV